MELLLIILFAYFSGLGHGMMLEQFITKRRKDLDKDDHR